MIKFEYEGNMALMIEEFHKWRKRLEKKGITITGWTLGTPESD